jgi:hypothetical protein
VIATLAEARTWRIIPSRYPIVGIWDRMADPNDIDDVMAIEGLTNERVRDEFGAISRVRPSDRISGPGSTPIMAAFAHASAARFNDATFSAYYAAFSEPAALAETRFGRERFLRATNQAKIDVEMRVYRALVSGTFDDVRGKSKRATLYDPSSYAASQVYARKLYDADRVDGIVYRSVRSWDDGECVAAFRTRCISSVEVTRHLSYVWNGERITHVYEKRLVEPA